MEEESEMMPMEGKQSKNYKPEFPVLIIDDTQTLLFM